MTVVSHTSLLLNLALIERLHHAETQQDRHLVYRSAYAIRRRVAYKESTGFFVDIVTRHDTPGPVW